MNTFLAVLLCALIAVVSCAVTQHDVEENLKFEKECMKQTGATDAEISDARNKGIYADEPKLAKQFLCVGLKQGVIDADGHVHRDALKEKLFLYIKDEAAVNAAVAKCLVEKATGEDTALSMAKCLFAK